MPAMSSVQLRPAVTSTRRNRCITFRCENKDAAGAGLSEIAANTDGEKQQKDASLHSRMVCVSSRFGTPTSPVRRPDCEGGTGKGQHKLLRGLPILSHHRTAAEKVGFGPRKP